MFIPFLISLHSNKCLTTPATISEPLSLDNGCAIIISCYLHFDSADWLLQSCYKGHCCCLLDRCVTLSLLSPHLWHFECDNRKEVVGTMIILTRTIKCRRAPFAHKSRNSYSRVWLSHSRRSRNVLCIWVKRSQKWNEIPVKTEN
jgi:hypothetical protein